MADLLGHPEKKILPFLSLICNMRQNRIRGKEELKGGLLAKKIIAKIRGIGNY